MDWNTFLEYGGAVGAYSLWRAYGKAIVDPIVERLRIRIHRAFLPEGTVTPQLIHRRLDLAFELFLSSKVRSEVIPPTAWGHRPPDVVLPDGTRTYGHEFEVIKSIAAFFEDGPVVWDVRDESWPSRVGCSQLMLASGSSNLATREIIGIPEKPSFIPSFGKSGVHLEYSIGLGTRRIKRMQYGELIQRQALAIFNQRNKRVAQASESSGLQDDDYLLVTRIPGPVPDTVLTVLSGLQGPGTRSAEMLFKSISAKELEELASRIDHRTGRVPFYQAVFRACRFETVDGSAVASQLELVTEGCPPERLAVR
jgi:hypothetical protein